MDPNAPEVPSIQVNSKPHTTFEATPSIRLKDEAESFPRDLSVIPDYDTSIELDHQLRNYGVDYARDKNKEFWPSIVWENLLTQKAIQDQLELREYDSKRARKLAEIIFGQSKNAGVNSQRSYRRAFAVLVLVGETHLIDHIVECEKGKKYICDQNPPLTIRAKRPKLLQHRDGTMVNCCIKGRELCHYNFFDYQMRLSVPTFRLGRNNTIRHDKFESHIILPWCEVETKAPVAAMSGGFGSVERVRIHPLCHEFHQILKSINVAGGLFAVKTLKQKDAISFKNEVDNLRRFSGLVHNHLVTLLATFDHNDKYNMIFPWANCDLESYWERFPKPRPRCPRQIRWVSQQCLGIMDAVRTIHQPTHLDENKFGRHGDIKAENILWYKSPSTSDRGILVISDLGLASFNSAKSRSMIPNQTITWTPGYRPPECDIEGGTISRAFDIWTLGCLYLEFMCWLLGGHNLRRQFERDRTTEFISGAQVPVFFDIRRPPPEDDESGKRGKYVFVLKDTVSKKINELHNHINCTPWVHDLLDLVEKQMLVVLAADQQRQRSPDLVDKLRQMDERCQNDKAYCAESDPKKRPWRSPTGTLALLNEVARKSVANNHMTNRLGVHERGERKMHHSLRPDELRDLDKPGKEKHR